MTAFTFVSYMIVSLDIRWSRHAQFDISSSVSNVVIVYCYIVHVASGAATVPSAHSWYNRDVSEVDVPCKVHSRAYKWRWFNGGHMWGSATGTSALKLPNPELRNEDDTRCSRHVIYIYGASSCPVVIWDIYGFYFPGLFIFSQPTVTKDATQIFTYIALSRLPYFFIIRIPSAMKRREAAHNSAPHEVNTKSLQQTLC